MTPTNIAFTGQYSLSILLSLANIGLTGQYHFTKANMVIYWPVTWQISCYMIGLKILVQNIVWYCPWQKRRFFLSTCLQKWRESNDCIVISGYITVYNHILFFHGDSDQKNMIRKWKSYWDGNPSIYAMITVCCFRASMHGMNRKLRSSCYQTGQWYTVETLIKTTSISKPAKMLWFWYLLVRTIPNWWQLTLIQN